MGKAQAGTPKAIGNAMKSRGLQRLRWYCQVCEKQCRDDNGFKCHTASETHLRQMLLVGENAGKHIDDYSTRFQSEFIAMLSRRWGTKQVRINQVYQEYIADKNHLHMNATKWLSLTEFTKHLGKTAVCHVEENEEKGWYVTWIDNSPKAMARSEANQKKERGDMDDESRQRKLIQEQIERARKEGIKRRVESAGGVFDEAAFEANGGNEGIAASRAIITGRSLTSTPSAAVTNELVRAEGAERVSLSLSFKIQPSSAAAASSTVSPPLPLASTSSTSLSPPAPPASLPSSSSDIDSSALLHDSSTNAITLSTSSSSSSSALPAGVSVASSASVTSSTAAVPSFKPSVNAFKSSSSSLLKSNPLKRPNPLKASSSSSSASSIMNGPQKRAAPGPGAGSSNVERIIQEEMARKMRLGSGGNGGASRGGEMDWEKERGTAGISAREEQDRKRAKYSFRG